MQAPASSVPILSPPFSTQPQNDTDPVNIYEKGKHKSHFMSALIPIRRINALRQMRTTFDPAELLSLANSISVQHLFHPLVVAQFDTEQAREHLRVINKAWGTNYRVNDLKATETEEGLCYFILIAGERRLRAIRLLWDNGCEACREDFAPELVPEGACYLSHFHDDRIPVRIRIDATPSIVLTLQLTENTYVIPPPHEVATAIAEYYPVWQLLNPEGKLKHFAVGVNRSVDTLYDYFRYNRLPEFVQYQVQIGAIPFGVALEIAKLQVDGESNDQLESWLRKAIAGMLSTPAFAQLITEYLKIKHSGQTSMFDIMGENARAEQERQEIRLIVEQRVTVALHREDAYWGRVNDLIRDGKMLLPDSPYSSKSVLRLMRKKLGRLRESCDLLKEKLGAEGYQQAIEVIADKDNLLLRLQEIAVRE